MLHHSGVRAIRPEFQHVGKGNGTMEMTAKPTEDISVRDVFGIDTDMTVKGFAERTERVPEVDPTYKFDPDTTLAILAGFSRNRRVMVQGCHGTGRTA